MSTINNNTYSIQNRWINEIAPKYFNIDELNMLRVGQFGYVNEIMSTSLEETLHASSILYNEIFPNKAIFPTSIYNYSNLAKFSDYNATPSEMKILIALRKEDIIANALKHETQSYSTFFIGKDTKIVIDGHLTFMLEYPIEIIVKRNKEDIILTPLYDMSYKNNNSNIRNKYIRSTSITIDKTNLLVLEVTVYQIERTMFDIDVISNDLIENISYDIDYDGMLSDFNVYYNDGTNDPILLEKYHLDELNPKSKFYCFYEYIGEQKIRISFSQYATAFKPEPGTNLKVEVITTLGEEGNISYVGNDIKIEFDDDIDPRSTRNYKPNNNLNYKSIFNLLTVQGDAINGANKKELLDIKKHTIDVFSTRNNYITDRDLNIFFNNMNNNSEILFFKRRDDILKRVYSAFLLLKDPDGDIMPSNTVNMKIDKNSLVYDSIEESFIIPAGFNYKLFNKKDNLYTKIDTVSNDELVNMDKRDEFVLTNPYLIKVSTKPVMVDCYLNSVDDDYYLSYNYINNSAFHEFAIDKISVYRDAINNSNKSYKFKFNLSTTLNLKTMYDEGYQILAKGIIKRNGNDLGYFDFKAKQWSATNNTIIFEADVLTTDFINANGDLQLVNTIKPMLDDYENKIPLSLPPDCNLEIAVFYNGYDNKDKKKLATVKSLQDYALVNTYETEKELSLVRNLSNIMQNTAKIESDGLIIRQLPMIKSLYLKDPKEVNKFYNELIYFRQALLDKLQLIENNFDIDLKFYNTYGFSRYFTIGTDAQPLDKVNIKLSFRIGTDVIVTEDIINEIKLFIKNYIERLNVLDNVTGSNYIYISNLIRNIEQELSYVKYTEFKGINNYSSDVQILENQFTDLSKFSKEQLINFVPEYLNINKILDKNGKLVSDIELEFI